MGIVFTEIREGAFGHTEFTDVILIGFCTICMFWTIVNTDCRTVLGPPKVGTYSNAFLGCSVPVSSISVVRTELNASSRTIVRIAELRTLV